MKQGQGNVFHGSALSIRDVKVTYDYPVARLGNHDHVDGEIEFTPGTNLGIDTYRVAMKDGTILTIHVTSNSGNVAKFYGIR